MRKEKNGKVAVYFFTNIEETIRDEQKLYSYDMYTIEVQKQDNLKERIENNYDNWIDFVKQKEYDKLAEEVRDKRNKLLEETDKEMCLDRLNFNLPSEITTITLLSSVKQFFEGMTSIFNGSMAKYRQELRDITKQPDFPYKVVFPEKPTNDKEA